MAKLICLMHNRLIDVLTFYADYIKKALSGNKVHQAVGIIKTDTVN